MQNRNIRSLVIICALWISGSWSNAVFSAIVEGLYEAEVPVLDQGREERKRAMAIGLAEVIGKVTGDFRAAADEAVIQATQNP